MAPRSSRPPKSPFGTQAITDRIQIETRRFHEHKALNRSGCADDATRTPQPAVRTDRAKKRRAIALVVGIAVILLDVLAGSRGEVNKRVGYNAVRTNRS